MFKRHWRPPGRLRFRPCACRNSTPLSPLYELKFEEARNQFETWQKSHPTAHLRVPPKRRAIFLKSAIGRAS